LAGIFKIGMQLFTACGPEGVCKIASLGSGIFLDLKFHDIPNTVAGAVRAAVDLPKLSFLNVHALGGLEMMRAAAEARGAKPGSTKLLGVTILTSMDAQAVRSVGISGTPAAEVLKLAKLVERAGLDGVVASTHEVKNLRKAFGKDFVLMVGGVRPIPAGGKRPSDDQARVATPAEAVRAGADYLIVGRPINAAPDPVAAAKAILNEMAEAEVSR
jgi:orotidine-5'-phosphate decarboxylase